ncbi:hypothetical protein RA210_U10599 [Rubrivivax sp. A210]|uniref:S8 family serine peptidase n=1 Tax=Rubrivivax sp. A210 TaxID=2772301 RepID=UPI00191B3AB1|nr:S8 family serine peptidase [Rubrivivax sp. A210]CAD5366985.1 hypothetical protein RA210_U10599 [Rubrivivax sp. A210]
MPRWTTPTAQQAGASTASKGPSAGVPAQAPADLPAACDPYLAWAVLTDWRCFALQKPPKGHAGTGTEDASESDPNAKAKAELEGAADAEAEAGTGTQADQWLVRVLLQAKSRQALARIHKDGAARIPAVYIQPLSGSSHPAGPAYATATLELSQLGALLARSDIRLELATPLKSQGSALLGDARGYFGQKTDEIEGARFEKREPAKLEEDTLRKVRGGVIAVFDYGCPFLRAEFTNTGAGQQGSTRLAALWQQDSSLRLAAPWSRPTLMGYGGQLDGAELKAQCMQAFANQAPADETETYRKLNYLIEYHDPRSRIHRATHGAHVLDVAGGRPDPVSRADDDAAGEARIVFVQMPEAVVSDSSGLALGGYLLDALRYTLDAADPKSPLVVNVSYGGTAGAHDGHSLIEEAMDDLLEQRPENFAIVVSAGNARRLGLHVKRTAAGNKTALFRIEVAAGDHTDTFIEFWSEASAGVAYRARLPDGDWSNWIEPGGKGELRDEATTEVVAALFNRSLPSDDEFLAPSMQGPRGRRTRALALLALCPTEAPDDDDRVLATPGLWEVEARPVRPEKGSVLINAWIRRDDARAFSGRVQTHFVGLQPDDTEHTLSDLASGLHTLVAGGFRWSDGMAVDYSSTGPRRRGQFPLVYGLCEWDSVDPGIRAAAVRRGETLLMNGTSVAAPVVARQVYNLMAAASKMGKSLNRSQLLDQLHQLARTRGSFIRVDDLPR